MLNKTGVWVQAPNVMAVEIDNELVMMSHDQKYFMSLNTTGKFIFDCFESPKSLDAVQDALCTQFEVDEVSAMQDIQLFVTELVENQLLVSV